MKCRFFCLYRASHYGVLIISEHDLAVDAVLLNNVAELGVTIQLVLTVSRGPDDTHQKENITLGEGPPIDARANNTTLRLDTSTFTTPSVSDGTSILQRTAEAERAKGSEGLTQINSHLAVYSDQLPGGAASFVTSTGARLASAASNLDLIVRFDNLLTDVSERRSFFLFI